MSKYQAVSKPCSPQNKDIRTRHVKHKKENLVAKFWQYMPEMGILLCKCMRHFNIISYQTNKTHKIAEKTALLLNTNGCSILVRPDFWSFRFPLFFGLVVTWLSQPEEENVQISQKVIWNGSWKNMSYT